VFQILLVACDDEARVPYVLGGLGVVQGACLRLGYRARLDRSAVRTPLVKSLAFDLRRDELMMALRPVPKKAIVETVGHTVFFVVTKNAADLDAGQRTGIVGQLRFNRRSSRRRQFGTAVRACKSAGARVGALQRRCLLARCPFAPGSSVLTPADFGAAVRCVQAVLTSCTDLPDLGLRHAQCRRPGNCKRPGQTWCAAGDLNPEPAD
jgi:hypothetical protein